MADGYPADRPRRASPGFFRPADPPTIGDVFAKQTFRERIHGWCLDVTGNGNAFPYVTYVYLVVKIGLYLGVFYAACLDTSRPLLCELNAKRFLLYNVLTDVLGLNSTNGGLGFRCKAPFVTWYNFLTPGTVTSPLLPGVRGIRSPALVALYLAYLGLLVRGLRAESIGLGEVGPVLAVLAAILPFDILVFLASRGEHFVYMMVCCCFEGPQWVFGCQCVQLALWSWAAASKCGPWFKYVTAQMTPNCQFLRLAPWVIKKLYNAPPTDLNPSRFCAAMAHFGTLQEFLMGVCCVVPPLRLVGVGWTVVFHTFIFSMFPFASVMEWNIFCMFASAYLFGMNEFAVPAHLSPVLASFLCLVLIAIPVWGQFVCAERIPFLLAYRPYAGNWRFGFHIVKKTAAEKMRRLKTFESPFIVESARNLPGDSRLFAEQFDYFFGANLMIYPSYRLLVPAMEALLEKHGWSPDDVYFVFQESFLNSVLGWTLGVGWHVNKTFFDSVQEICKFSEHEYHAFYCEPMTTFSRTIRWHVTDVGAKGHPVVMSGEALYSDLEKVQPWGATREMLGKKSD
eukprot:TRINITY_DN22048_c0_g1_i1.p1 TRINITY_DN22048_c0_g1~~TRINITY_DN22048_c0_g1_i1.p1  ORF type:complete len:567 (+),score=152.40 TRINITY_DN22048_c0_g1_i1:65-1765(+)